MTATIYRPHVVEVKRKEHKIDKDALRGDWTNGRRVNLYKHGVLEYEDFPCPDPSTAIDYAEAGYTVEFRDGLQML